MKTTIYTDDIYNYIDENKDFIIECLKDNEIEINDNNIFDEAKAQNDSLYYDLLSCLNSFDALVNYEKILVCAELGLWYGKRSAKKYFNNLKDAILSCVQDINTLYFNKKNSALTLSAIHHDGENIFKFYKIINNKKYAINLNDILSAY